jgi:glycosyltransferase involved in cell wall biosynthesis
MIVRRRPDDIQGGLSRFMRLTGIDLISLANRDGAGILEGQLDLQPIVDNHVTRHQAELKATGVTDDELAHAIDHVRWVVHQWGLWAREQRELDAVVSQTERGMRELAAFFGARAGEGLTFVHNGISFKPECSTRVEALVEEYRRRSGLLVHRGDAPHKERFTFHPRDKVVLFVGRSVPSKGIYELARALRLLHRQSNGRVKGLFVGHFGTWVRRQLAAVDPDQARDYLLFTGRIWDHDVLASLYAFGDVTALASHVEPFAHTVLESYLMGTPCVVTEGTSAADAYLDEPRRHGVEFALPVARPQHDGIRRYFGVDVNSLARQLHSVLYDDGLARRLGRDGKAYVQRHYNDRRMGDRYLELFDRLQHTSEPVGGNATTTS